MTNWFKIHPEFLVKESESLRSDENYKEIFQVRNNLFLSYGLITLRLDKIYYFPILIVYTEATPYALPIIYPIKTELTFDFLIAISHRTVTDLQNLIYGYIKFYPQFRHQNKNGILCIIEWDNLDDGSIFYGIKSILKRVKNWFRGTITGIFDNDNQEIEFYYHFNNPDLEYKFQYPQTFITNNFVEGILYGVRYRHFKKNEILPTDRSIYIGILVEGKSLSGLFETLNTKFPEYFLEKGISDAIAMANETGILEPYLKSGELIKVNYFKIETELTPFENLNDLITIIGSGNFEYGIKRIMPLYLTELKLKPDYFFIAISFPNRKHRYEFQIFKVQKNGKGNGILLNTSDVETFNHLINDYSIISAIQTELFDDATYHERNLGRADRTRLKNAEINILGTGAIGSEVADSLAKAGIGTINLMDNQEMKGHNSVRHLAGLDFIGFPKVIAVQKIIQNHNPFINVNPFSGDITEVNIDTFIPDNTFSISCIADDNIEGYLNEKAVLFKKPIFYVRALRGGKAARIFRVIPGKDACMNCLQIYRKEKKYFIDIESDPNLPTLKNECNNPIRPASAADLKLISALTSRILLDELQAGFGDSNHWIWSTEKLPQLEPFKLNIQKIPTHPNCQYCNRDNEMEVQIPIHILNYMRSLIAPNPNIETGGILMGYRDLNGNLLITHASDPGPNAICTDSEFLKDNEFCQKFLDDVFLQSNKTITYIGEWHSHPNSNNLPSQTDIKSLSEIAAQNEYLTDRPLMIIFTNTGDPSFTIHPNGKPFYFANFKIS